MDLDVVPPLKQATPLLHKSVFDIPRGSKLRVTTKNNIIAEGVLIENPKQTPIPDWIQISHCVYIQPASFGSKNMLKYRKDELADLEILSQPKKPVPKPRPTVMNTLVVQNRAQLTNVIDSLKLIEDVGLAFHGEQVGRTGQIAWVTLNCRGHLVNIDMVTMGATKDTAKVWPTLQEHLFENDTITKVVHDLRPIADYLYHRHAIKLKNVFDTQMADFYVNHHKNAESANFTFPRDPKTQHIIGLPKLEDLLSSHLGDFIMPQEIEMYTQFRSTYHSNKTIMERPFKIDETAKGIAVSVKYLVELKRILSKKLLNKYYRCVARQMSSVVEGDMMDMINFLGKPELVSEDTVNEIIQK